MNLIILYLKIFLRTEYKINSVGSSIDIIYSQITNNDL